MSLERILQMLRRYMLTKDDKVDKRVREAMFIFKYYRYLEHVGTNEDFGCGYRSKDEYDKWYEVDPVNMQRKKL